MRTLCHSLLFFCLLTVPAFSQIEKIRPVPSKSQLQWQRMEMVYFVHFSPNTFTDKEWGDGTEDPRVFNPTALDTRQWAKTIKEAGGKLLILTCKHHDGFCLWPSRYTEHSVKNSPWKNGQGDVVKETAEACREFGLKFGVYLSPWDRHEKTYGDSPKYNEYFCSQLTELLTNYGEIAEVWFDGACGEGPNGKRQVYDFESYYTVIKQLQPDAVIAIVGPDIRWVGNESGTAKETEWSVRVVNPDTLDDPRIAFNSTLTWGNPALLFSMPDHKTDIAFSHLMNDKNQLKDNVPLIWYPAETDVSIRPGWFYHEKEDTKVKSLEHLTKIYFESVGRNTVLLLNVPPDRRGLFHENDVARLQEFKAYLDAMVKVDYASNAVALADATHDEAYPSSHLFDKNPDTVWTTKEDTAEGIVEIDLGKPQTFDVVMLQESIELGQRVAAFTITYKDGHEWKPLVEGTTIGYKRLLPVPEVTTQNLRLTITKSRARPVLHTVSLFKRP